MIPLNIFNILKENEQIQQVLNEFNDFEILIKQLDKKEIERLIHEYPNFFNLMNDTQKMLEQELKINGKRQSILCLTFVKQEINNKNYINLRKTKIYIDELNGKILKILNN